MKHPRRRDKDAAPWWGPILIGVVLVGVLWLFVYRVITNIRSVSPEWKTMVHKDFPGLEEANFLAEGQRQWVIQTANREPCSCLCGHTLASCLKADIECPIRSRNFTRIKELIRESEKHART